MIEDKNLVHVDLRITFERVTERILAHPSGEVVDEWTRLRPVSLEKIRQVGEATPEELFDVTEAMAETDDHLNTLTNGALYLLHTDEPHTFRNPYDV